MRRSARGDGARALLSLDVDDLDLGLATPAASCDGLHGLFGGGGPVFGYGLASTTRRRWRLLAFPFPRVPLFRGRRRRREGEYDDVVDEELGERARLRRLISCATDPRRGFASHFGLALRTPDPPVDAPEGLGLAPSAAAGSSVARRDADGAVRDAEDVGSSPSAAGGGPQNNKQRVQAALVHEGCRRGSGRHGRGCKRRRVG